MLNRMQCPVLLLLFGMDVHNTLVICHRRAVSPSDRTCVAANVT